MSNTLVAYYSWSNGNTEGIAKRVASELDADLVRIETVEPYHGSYDDVVEQAKRETERGFQPEIEPIDVTAYDTVVVGTPTWWYTMAPAVARFFSDNEWAGKTVSNFMTNAGWPGTVIEDMEAACQPATLGPSLEVLFDSAGGSTQLTSDDDIDAWIESLRGF